MLKLGYTRSLHAHQLAGGLGLRAPRPFARSQILRVVEPSGPRSHSIGFGPGLNTGLGGGVGLEAGSHAPTPTSGRRWEEANCAARLGPTAPRLAMLASGTQRTWAALLPPAQPTSHLPSHRLPSTQRPSAEHAAHVAPCSVSGSLERSVLSGEKDPRATQAHHPDQRMRLR